MSIFVERTNAMRLLNLLFFVAGISFGQDPDKILVGGSLLSPEEVLSRYIQIPSLSANEKTAGEWMTSVCRENGLYIQNMGNENGNFNFAASIFPLDLKLPNLVFLNHMDVVDAGDTTLWKHPPFSGFIDSTTVWGRGAFDNKGAAIMQLLSILNFRESAGDSIPFNVTYLSVSCEEDQCDGGMKYVLENYFDLLNTEIVIGEGPTELGSILELTSKNNVFGISVAHKRPLWLRLELEIPTLGHGSITPHEYANKEMTLAISRLLKKKQKALFIETNKSILKSLAQTEKGFKKFALKHPGFFKPILIPALRKQPELFSLFSNTLTVTSFDSHNSTVNKIPGRVSVLIDCRLLPSFENEKMLSRIKKTLKNDSIKIHVIQQMDEMAPSSETSSHFQHLKKAIQTEYPDAQVFPVMVPVTNDVGQFRARGVQGLSIIPIILDEECLKCVHAENEHIPIKALYEGSHTYYHFLQNTLHHYLND
ncbi:MAG: M20/M25/M40 family metallo-hydrolase [Bacteroidetes bacterium]|nr:MAG: M20/M25/M40 family metallo-hydrolase [Bacteroidota bacterium]